MLLLGNKKKNLKNPKVNGWLVNLLTGGERGVV
jgi:hypothetical protein